jgi:hypothetical protein
VSGFGRTFGAGETGGAKKGAGRGERGGEKKGGQRVVAGSGADTYETINNLTRYGCSDTLKIEMSIVMEENMKRTLRKISETRELTDKELREITSAMGDTVRSQSLSITHIIEANLKAEFATCRKNTPTLVKAKKSVAA